MRVVVDTNVLIAAYIARSGACAALYEHLCAAHAVVTSALLLAEFRHKLVVVEALSFPPALADQAMSLVAQRALVVTAAPLVQPVCRDSDDDAVLSVALGAGCACIVTMDRDLLTLHPYAGVSILHPRDFWAFERAVW